MKWNIMESNDLDSPKLALNSVWNTKSGYQVGTLAFEGMPK